MNSIYDVYDVIQGLYRNRLSIIMMLIIISLTVMIGIYVCNSVITAQTANLTLNTTALIEVR